MLSSLIYNNADKLLINLVYFIFLIYILDIG